MKKLLFIILAFSLVTPADSQKRYKRWPTCMGKTPCHACKNCKYCKFCHKNGGVCGTCLKKGAKPKPQLTERDTALYK
ncbi:hypothetical protein BDD43_3410 [Mucilaginibacter gracilis]|uniref:Uncharacterized protein n=1 Tax=Mucilaginibacter gracilis TaxID=423350 RepID=A0A495J499_9SPHI|nr:hypothetical protein [Mucilaginibacter gracilis]RKR83208.1 hypothetical protein BDD43_3410 [Mucilaginibacter gracilis]